MKDLKILLRDWNDPYGDRNVPDAEELVNALVCELSAKDSVIELLKTDIEYHKKQIILSNHPPR